MNGVLLRVESGVGPLEGIPQRAGDYLRVGLEQEVAVVAAGHAHELEAAAEHIRPAVALARVEVDVGDVLGAEERGPPAALSKFRIRYGSRSSPGIASPRRSSSSSRSNA